ncbi:MAG: permease prefix domain 2-containing transporter [Cytophagales bacterium]
MNEPKNIQPPAWATRLLSWYCKPRLLEDLQGDLNEYFERNVKSKGATKAKLIYVIDVVKFFRPYTIRKPKLVDHLIHWIMIGSYVKTSARSLGRNKLFSFINIFGLAVSMSLGLVLIGVLSDILSYDKFHENHSRIYRVISRYEYLGDKGNEFMATTSLRSGKLIEENFTSIKGAAMLRNDFEGDMQWGEKVIPLRGYWANPSALDVFSFPLVKGNAATALKNPFSILLTETSARKLFGNVDALGKEIVLNKDRAYTVTGIVKDIPFFSHIKFDMLASLSTRELLAKNDKDELAWDNVWNTWVYLLIPDEKNLSAVQANLAKLSKKEDATVQHTHIELALQPMDDIMFTDSMGNEIGPVLGKTLLWVFGGLTFVVILSACFNYTNLSIARSLRRTREVGMRRAIGAMRNHVVLQFMVEAIMISFLALGIALLGFFLIRPQFLTIEPDIQKMFTLQISPVVILCFVVFALLVGVAAGLFPALFFAKVKAISVLKSTLSFGGAKKINGRKVLTVVQY